MGHVILVVIIGTTILVPYHWVKSLWLIGADEIYGYPVLSFSDLAWVKGHQDNKFNIDNHATSPIHAL